MTNHGFWRIHFELNKGSLLVCHKKSKQEHKLIQPKKKERNKAKLDLVNKKARVNKLVTSERKLTSGFWPKQWRSAWYSLRSPAGVDVAWAFM